MSTLRLVHRGWVFHLKGLTLSWFFLLTTVFMPVILATVAFFMFQAGQREGTLFWAALGAAVYGIWSSTLFGSGGAIQWQRWQGTLELLVAAPAPFFLVVLPLTLATSTIGIYSLCATLLWGRLAFGIPFTVEHPLWFAVAVPVTIVGLGLLGMVFAATFVLYRHANALSNMLEWPVLLVTGLLVPLSLLPSWVLPISWALAPTWGMRALRDAALGGSPAPDVAMTLLLGAGYVAIAAFFLRYFERAARRQATLSLT
ncbi:MAG TPA: ABC transporter permease [Gaiellaceae bacterium]|nr:ABC transporter permease [Gaiellaceae bacterium]